jgi:hypothetical protein
MKSGDNNTSAGEPGAATISTVASFDLHLIRNLIGYG